MIERFHQQLKEALRARLLPAAADWEWHLPWVMLEIRTAPKDDCGISAAEAVFNQPLMLPGQLLTAPRPAANEQLGDLLRSDLTYFQPLPMHQRSYEPADGVILEALFKAQFVYVRHGGVSPALSSKYQGPYRVVCSTQKYFKVQVGQCTEVISVDRLRLHLGTAPVSPPSPQRRGWPALQPSSMG
jgi:hypothetical protein